MNTRIIRIFKTGMYVFAVLFMAAGGFMSCMKGGKLASIAVTTNTPIIANRTSSQYTATATFSDGTTVNWTSAVIWSLSSTGVATINNTLGSNGIATALSTGSATITATDVLHNLSATAMLTVTNPLSLAATPIDPIMVAGTTHQFAATATLPPDNTAQDLTTGVFWNSSNEDVATVGNTQGSIGLVTAVSAGTTTITATDRGTNLSGSTTLTVTSAPILSIAVSPLNLTIAQETTQQFSALVTFTDSTTLDLTSSMIWSSSNTGVATINAHGLAASVAAGYTTITATDPITNQSGSTTLAVSAP